jgi:hypothetical protein
MTLLHKISIWILLIFLPFGLFGQAKENYENEEIKVINQFLFKLVDGERLSAINKSDSSLIVYFQTGQMCNLDKDPLFKGDYKSNKLLKRLKNNYLGERVIDSTKIERFDKIKIVFENKLDYSIEKYESDKIIGTINISRISFNKTLTIGYFYYDVYCGEDCGWGDLIKIEKKNGIWEITDYLISWIS